MPKQEKVSLYWILMWCITPKSHKVSDGGLCLSLFLSAAATVKMVISHKSVWEYYNMQQDDYRLSQFVVHFLHSRRVWDTYTSVMREKNK